MWFFIRSFIRFSFNMGFKFNINILYLYNLVFVEMRSIGIRMSSSDLSFNSNDSKESGNSTYKKYSDAQVSK